MANEDLETARKLLEDRHVLERQRPEKGSLEMGPILGFQNIYLPGPQIKSFSFVYFMEPAHFLKARNVRFAFDVEAGIYVDAKDMAAEIGVQSRVTMPTEAEWWDLRNGNRESSSTTELHKLQDVYDAIDRALEEDKEPDKETIEEEKNFLASYNWRTFLDECVEEETEDVKGHIKTIDKKIAELQGEKRVLEERIAALSTPLEPPKKKARVEQ